jgi:hypothetical protein
MQNGIQYCFMLFEAHFNSNNNMYFILTDLCSNHNPFITYFHCMFLQNYLLLKTGAQEKSKVSHPDKDELSLTIWGIKWFTIHFQFQCRGHNQGQEVSSINENISWSSVTVHQWFSTFWCLWHNWDIFCGIMELESRPKIYTKSTPTFRKATWLVRTHTGLLVNVIFTCPFLGAFLVIILFLNRNSFQQRALHSKQLV